MKRRRTKLPTRQSLREALEATYQDIQAHTFPVCRDLCERPLSCCDDLFCEVAQVFAKDAFGVTLTPADPVSGRPRFLTATGCVVPPYLRPGCTSYTCLARVQSDGLHGSVSPEWDERLLGLMAKGRILSDALHIPEITGCLDVLQRRGGEMFEKARAAHQGAPR